MLDTTRRHALRAGALSLAALAGCSALAGNDTGRQPEVVSLSVGNLQSQPVTVDVQLSLDGEVVFWRLVDVESARVVDGTLAAGAVSFAPPAFPERSGEWRLRARVPSSGEQSTLAIDDSTYDGACLRVNVDVQEDGHLALHAGQRDESCLGGENR